MAASCESGLCTEQGVPKALAASNQTSVLTCEHFRAPLDVRGLPAKQSIDPRAMSPLGTGLMNALGGIISGVTVAGIFNPWVSKELALFCLHCS